MVEAIFAWRVRSFSRIAIARAAPSTGSVPAPSSSIRQSEPAFASLIISFVVAIVACAYNYFLDNFDEEEVEEEEEEVDIQPEKHTQKLAKVTTSESIKSSKPSKKSSK